MPHWRLAFETISPPLGTPRIRKVDVRLPGKGNSHGARPVHLIITMIKWIRTSRLAMPHWRLSFETLSPPLGTPRENNYFTEMCSGSEAGSYLGRTDLVYHSTLGLGVMKKKKKIPP